MTPVLRLATEHDVAGMMVVMEQAFDARFGEAWSTAQLLGSLASPDSWALVRLVDDAPATKVAGFTLSRRIGPEAELLLIGVAPSCRGQGVGAALLSAVRLDAARRGAETMFLEVRDGNIPAIALYQKYGFVEVGRRRGYYSGAGSERFDAITMRCDLN